MSGAQLGKSSMLENFIGFIIIDLDSGPILLVHPRDAEAEAFSRDRLAPMIRDCPGLRGMIAESRSRDSHNTVLHKKLTGGRIAALPFPRRTRRQASPCAVFDTAWWTRWIATRPARGSEGDPVNIAATRTADFLNGRRDLGVGSRLQAWRCFLAAYRLGGRRPGALRSPRAWCRAHRPFLSELGWEWISEAEDAEVAWAGRCWRCPHRISSIIW